MALNFGQLIGGAGIVAGRQRQAENAEIEQRGNLMRIQEANRLMEIRARMGEGTNEIANAPLPQFVQTPGTVIGNPNAPTAPAPAPVPAPAPAAAPASATTTPVAPPANVPTTTLPAAPAAGLRTPAQLASIPTDQLTTAEFQALPQQERLKRLQIENDRRKLSRIDTAVAAPPAAAFDVVTLPYTGAATLLQKGLNAVDFARFGRAAGFYDPDVTSVTIPGAGSITPFTDRLRKSDAENQPITEAQLLERLKAGEATKAKAVETERVKNAEVAQKQGLEDWQLDAKGKPVRGLVNNNPGNIRPSTQYTWQGQVGIDKGAKEAAGFVQFASPEAGIRAMTLNLLSYDQQGINTVQGIINRWAPPSENKTGAYINQVAKELGVKPTDTINLKDAAVMRQLVTSIIQFENGKNPYNAQIIDTGIALGFNKESPIVTASTGKAPPVPTQAQTVTQAVNTGTPKDVATAASTAVPVQPAKDGVMYGPAQIDASARNPQIQQLLTTRAMLQKQVALYNQYGMGDKAIEAAAKIQAIDLGMYKNQADIGLYEGATTGNFSRAMSVLSTFTGAPHQVLSRNDGKFDLYINGKVAKSGLEGPQVEQLVRTQVDTDYRQQLAKLQIERSAKRFDTDEEIRKKASEETLRSAREIQLEILKGNTKLAEEKIKLAGFKLIGSGAGDGKAYYSNGLGDVFVIDGQNKTATINGAKVDLGVVAQQVSGVDRSIWSTVNPPQQVVR
jgi:hypothetical protein